MAFEFDANTAKADGEFDPTTATPVKPAGAIRKMADLGLSAAKGVIAVPEAAVGLADLATQGRAGKAVENLGVRFKDAKDVLTGFQSDDLKGKQQEFQQADGILAKTGVALSNPSLIANTVAESVPLMGAGAVPARAVMALAPKIGAMAAGAIGEGVAGAGSAGEQIRQETADGLLTGKQAALGAASGASTALFGAAGGKMAKRLGIGDVDTMLAKGSTEVAQVAGQQPKGAIRRMGEAAVSEGLLEELPQSVSEQALQNVALDRPVTQGLEDAAVMGTLSGGLMGAGAGAISRPAPQPVPTAADVGGSAGQGLAGTEPAPTKSQAMGINPAAGPMSAAAAMAVDSGAHETALQQAALAAQDATKDGADKDQSTGPVSNPVTNPVGNTLTPAANVNPATGEIISAFDQREADRPKPLPTDLPGVDGNPAIYNFVQAKQAAKAAGEGYAPFRLDKGKYVVRKQETNPQAATPDTAPAPSGQADAVQPEKGDSADTTGGTEQPNRALSAKTNPQPTTMGTQRNVNAGPGFSAKDVVKAQAPEQAPEPIIQPEGKGEATPALSESLSNQEQKDNENQLNQTLVDAKQSLAAAKQELGVDGVSQSAHPGLPGEGAGVSQPTQVASTPEFKAIQSFIEAIDKGGLPLNPIRANHLGRSIGLEISKKSRPEDVIQRLRSALARHLSDTGTPVSQPQEQTNGTQADQAQPQQTQPEAGPSAGIQEPAANAGVGGKAEGVDKPSLKKAQAKRVADKQEEAPTVESVAKAIQQKVASNRRKYREKSRKEREAKGYAPNSTPESEQTDYDAEIGGAPGDQQQKSAAALLGNDPVPLIDMFVNGNFEASEDVFKEITGVRIRGLSAKDKKSALYKWANWTPDQIAQAEQSATDKEAARAEKFKQDDLKSDVLGAWLALDNLRVGETKVNGTETGQEFVIRTIASGFDKAHSQKKGVAPIYGFTDGKSFTTLKNGALTKFVKAAIAFGGLDKAMEYVNPPKTQAPAGFKDRSIETGKDAGMIAKAFVQPTAETSEQKQPVAPVDTAEVATESVAKPERQYHLVAINEKTGAKTFLTRTPVTHAEAVTMKGKYDDKPGRRIQLEDVTPVEPASNPLDVPTDAQTQSADAVKVGRFDHIQVPDETTRWMGFDGRKTVKADLQALAQRHSEYYQTAQQVRDDIEFVLGNPDGWYIHKDNKVVLFRERVGQGAIPQARVEVEADADTLSVRSVYVGGKRQIAKKMADKREVLGSLDLGGQSPDSLTIAEYLKALGNGSSRPASPSGEVLKADDSVVQPAPEGKSEPAAPDPKTEAKASKSTQGRDGVTSFFDKTLKAGERGSAAFGNLLSRKAFLGEVDNLLKIPGNSGIGEQTSQLIDSDAATSEGSLNGVRANTQALRDILYANSGTKFGLRDSDVETQRLVLSHVIALSQNSQVLEAVVQLVPVDVMDDLSALQLPAQSLFNDPSVIKRSISGKLGDSIPLLRDSPDAFVRAITLAGAEVSSSLVVSELERPTKDGSAAGSANNGDFGHGVDSTRNDGIQTKETDKGVAMFSRGAQTQATAKVQPIVDAIKAGWKNAPPIVVAFDLQDPRIPERVRQEDLKQRSGGAVGTPEGFFYKGTVYLMSSKVKTANDVARVLAHETLGHYGLRGMFGDTLTPILRQIAHMRKDEVRAKAIQYGLKGISDLDRRTAAEEVLAEMAQNTPEIGFVRRAIAAIRTWLRRNVPGFKSIGMTDDEIIRSYIIPARNWVERGAKSEAATGMVPAFSRADEPFYSALSEEVAGIPAKAQSAMGWQMNIAGLVKAGKVKQDEVEWSGLTDWLKLQTGKVTKEQISEYLDANGVKVNEVIKGGDQQALDDWENAKNESIEKLHELGYEPIWSENGEGRRIEGVEQLRSGRRFELGDGWEDIEAEEEMLKLDDILTERDSAILLPNDERNLTKYDQYQLPGGTNYREVLLTLPRKSTAEPKREAYEAWAEKRGLNPNGSYTEEKYQKETGEIAPPPRTMTAMNADKAATYKSGHWDQPNVLAHIRLNDRTDADGKRVLFVEEIQSDWGQDGKKKGFSGSALPLSAAEENRFQMLLEDGRRNLTGAALAEFEALLVQRDAAAQAKTAPPLAPFVTATDKWLSLALKRVIKMAVDGGYDKVAFVNGEQSASRYDLSKHVDSIEWTTYDGKGYISLHGLKGVSDQTLEIGVDKKTGIVGPMDIGAPSEWQGKHLSDVVGKDVADKVLDEDKGKLSGDGLKVGGSGMKAFYDKIVPSVAKDVLRKLGGGQMETVEIPDDRSRKETVSDFYNKRTDLQQPGFTITPKMQDKAEEGLPMFSRQSQTDTPAFKKWFGDSKVVDADGKPLVVYHGTDDGISVFDENKSRKGFWFSSDYSDASDYGDNTVEAYLSLKNPAYFERTSGDKGVNEAISIAKSEGYDGLIVTAPEDGDANGMYWPTNYVAFRPEQIKSAIGNNGNFDATNPDIRFSRSVGETLKAITVTDIKARTGNKLADYRGLGLQFLGGRQIVDLYGKDLPQLGRYTQMVQQMSADANEVGAQADGIATGWSKLTDERQLAELMHDATLAQIDPAKEFVDGDNRMQWGKLNADFKALSPEAKTVYTQARDAYEEHYAQVREAIRDKIERSEMSSASKAAMLERMDGEFFDKIKGVYFPLARFGKYVVVTRGPAGVVNVSRAETLNEAEALRTQMRAAYPSADGFTVGKVIKDKEFNASRDSVGRGFLKELFGVLDEKGMGEELQDAVNQLYLASMPDLSWAKHGIHRKGTPGFSQDARRAFAQNMFHGARYLAKLRYADQLQDKLIGMQNYVESQANVEAFDSVKAQQVVDELNKRHDSLMNPKSNPLSTALTSFGFVFHMGLSPASAMVNLSGTAMVAYPIMGAKWGFDKAAGALLKAGKEAATNKNDISAALNGDEKRAYDAAVKAGTIDVTAAHDLAGIAQGEDAGVMWKMRPVMKWASFLFHHAERFNRQVTFVASYRLARETGVRHEVAFEQATKATYDGHFDYASSNRPRVMQGNAAKVLLLFKQYGQNMVYTLARQAQLAMKAETPQGRKEARKALGGLLVMHAAGAGVLGLPLVGTLLAAASMLGGSDDEPWDAEVALRNMLADAFGQKPAEVMAKGFSRLTPWDISGRVGLDKLILPDIQEGLEGQRLGESVMAAALGPVAGIGINMLKGMQEISEGHMARGLETMMPAALRGPMKALRYEQEGAKDKTGIVIQDEVGVAGIAGQALGFSPSDVRNATEGRSAIYNADKRLMQRRTELMRAHSDAVLAKNVDRMAEVREEIKAFNEKNPNRRIGGMQLMQSVRAKTKRINESEDGVYLPRKRRDAIEEGRFAVAD